MNDKGQYEIPTQNMDDLRHQIEILNRRAGKLNVPKIEIQVDGTFAKRWRQDTPAGFIDRAREYQLVRIIGTTPKFDGWSFAATLEWAGEANIIRKAPGVDVEFDSYRESRPQCDHCKAKRNRRDTFLVIHDDGRVFQLGRQCIKDFLGHEDPKAIAQWAEILFKASDLGSSMEDYDDGFGGGGGSRVPTEHDTEVFLQHCAEWTIREGFRSKKTCQEHEGMKPTSARALMSMYPISDRDRKELEKIGWGISDEAKELASKARSLVVEKLGNLEHRTDFDHNILLLSKSESFTGKNVGIVAYVIGWFKRETEKDAERKVKNEKPSEYWGEIGTRCREVRMTYLGSASFDTEYGILWIHRFDLDGSRFIWKTGKDPAFDEGDSVSMTFTIKDHSEFHGKKQTVITRCLCHEVGQCPKTDVPF